MENNTPIPGSQPTQSPDQSGQVVQPTQPLGAPAPTTPETQQPQPTSFDSPQTPAATPSWQQPAQHNNYAQPAAQPSVFGAAPQSPQPNYGTIPQTSAAGFGQTGGNKKRVVLLSAVGLAVLLFGSSAAAYFGYLVPNKPENIWATALERTSAGYDKLVEYEKTTKDLTTAKFTGNYKLTGEFSSDGTMQGQFDENNFVVSADIGAVTTRINFEARGIDSPNSTNPDIYAKVSGLKGLGAMLGDDTGMLDSIDSQWYVADHTLLDSAFSSAGVDADMQLTADDLTAIEKAVGEVNKEYLFSADTNKRVLTVVQNVGKEKQDDRDVYRYKVGLDKQHTKDYLTALVAKLETTPIKKFLDGKSLKDTVDLDSLLKEVDKYNTSDTADVFVDTATKTIRTVRFSDKKNPDKNYLDLGVHYTGGDVVPFVLSFHGEEDGVKGVVDVKMSVDMKKNTVDLVVDGDLPAGDTNEPRIKGNLKLSATMSKDKVSVQKPAGAKSVNELLAPFYGTGFSAEDGINDIEGLDPSTLLGGRLSI